MSLRRNEVEIACLQYEDDDGFDFFSRISEYKTVDMKGIGIAELVQQHRPASNYDDDNDGEYIDVVFKIGEQYFRKSGHYSSWDADDWDGAFEEVKPAQVQRTEWKNINERG